MVKQEPVRVSGAILFERNLLDPVQLISTSVIYLFCCIMLASDASYVKFLVIFSLFCGLFNYHLESYRSFERIRRSVYTMESADKPALRAFLSSHLRYVRPVHIFEHPTDGFTDAFTSPKVNSSDDQHTTAKNDTYRWVNKMMKFFWPYLSHVVHHELNNFLVNSRGLARSKGGLKRLLYAFFKHVDANIMAIEHCELGTNAPCIKRIHVEDERRDGLGLRRSLIYDLDLNYEGNMNIALICRYCCCCTSRLGLKDVFVHLNSRLILGPIDSRFPSIERISYSLLKLPKFGYKGIALVELAELRLAKRSINRLIKEHLLYPTTISIDLKNLVNKLGKRQETVEDLHQPGRIESSNENQNNQPEYIPWHTRFVARLMYSACICTNFCLRFCQDERLNQESRRLERLRRPG
jgi:hypothetical protein